MMGLTALRRHRHERQGLADQAPLSEDSSNATETPLPEDFPGRGALLAAGYTTLESLRGLSEADLIAIKGIGPKLAKQILQALEAE
jgi:predicted flap endonuclease-1-like 5' DNA nuclease